MRLQQIEQVIAIAEEGSIGKAAQKLFISQPSLSMSVKQLENELGEAIFERTGKGSVLTPFGNEFLSMAKPLLRQYDVMNDYIAGRNERSAERFSVASQYLKFGSSLFVRLCDEYQDSPYELSFFEAGLQSVIDRVKRQDAEIGLIVLPEDQESIMKYYFKRNDIAYIPLVKENYAVLVRKGHPLEKCLNGLVDSKELLPYPFAVYEDVNSSFQDTLSVVGLKPIRQKIIVSDRATFMDVITGTDAYAVVSHRTSAYETTKYYNDIRILRLSGNISKLMIACIRNTNRPLSEIAGRYIGMLKETMRV